MATKKKTTKKEDSKVEKKAPKLDMKEKNLKKLVTLGKKQGYLTLSQILELFPNAEEDIETLDFI